MGRKHIRYTLNNAIRWAAGIRTALDEGRAIPFDFRIPGFSDDDDRPAAFAHWKEFAERALASTDAAKHWSDQFRLFRNQDSMEDELTCLLSVLRCVQRELDGTAGKMTKDHILAAEIFYYSFANYRDHLGIGNIRFEDLMPDDARTLKQAVEESWSLGQVAQALDVDTDSAASLIQSTVDAIAFVEAETPADSFRIAIHNLIRRASERGLQTDAEIKDLVTQICYRVSDFSCLLEIEGKTLSDYCEKLREEPDDIDDDPIDRTP